MTEAAPLPAPAVASLVNDAVGLMSAWTGSVFGPSSGAPSLTAAASTPTSVAAEPVATRGASVVVVGAVPTYGAAVAALLVFGASYLVIAATMNTTIQIVVREDLRGKVIAIYLMCLTGGLPLGLLAWGQVADVVGLRVTTVAAGVTLVVVTVVFALTGRFRAMAVDARSTGARPDPGSRPRAVTPTQPGRGSR